MASDTPQPTPQALAVSQLIDIMPTSSNSQTPITAPSSGQIPKECSTSPLPPPQRPTPTPPQLIQEPISTSHPYSISIRSTSTTPSQSTCTEADTAQLIPIESNSTLLSPSSYGPSHPLSKHLLRNTRARNTTTSSTSSSATLVDHPGIPPQYTNNAQTPNPFEISHSRPDSSSDGSVDGDMEYEREPWISVSFGQGRRDEQESNFADRDGYERLGDQGRGWLWWRWLCCCGRQNDDA